MDALEHSFHVTFHINAEKSENNDSEGLQSLLPDCVFCCLMIMCLSIYFDGEHEFIAEEIHNVVINGFLSQELVATCLPAFELIP